MADEPTDYYYAKFWAEKNARDAADRELAAARKRITELEAQREVLLSLLAKSNPA